jgi:hypothetical protein
MKNKRIINSWNKVEPDNTADERMLAAILARKHSGRTVKKKWLAPIAASLALVIAITIPFLNNGSGDFDLKLSDSGIKVNYTDKVPSENQSSELVYLTEHELLSGSIDQYKVVVFEGTVKAVDNIKLDFGETEFYRAIVQIEVTEVIRGNLAVGDVLSVLLPNPIDSNVEVSDTLVTSQIRVGTKGIFMPMIYDETSIYSTNEKTLYLIEIAEAGFSDGQRWAFLETQNGLLYANDAYPSFSDVESLEDIKEIIHSKFQ